MTFKIGEEAWNKGIPRSEQTKEKIRAKLMGRKQPTEQKEKHSLDMINWHKHHQHPLKNKHHSELTKQKMSSKHKNIKFSEEWRLHKSIAITGFKHPNWQGGIALKNKTERQQIMKSLEYKMWRENVFKRDSYTCVICNYKGKNLQADHIKSFALYPDLRFNINNGRTLCIKCHKNTDTYGNKSIYK